ncbi:MAG TPA: basic secretory protein-like protein [Vicinamibacteria bacterium]|nr:basic secretory protein-like protein [Vicinamibacteria bacterium]
MTRLATSTVLLTAIALAVPASGQYFGRNKAQYEDFDFEILRTEHFDIYFYPEEEEAARIAGQMAERWYERLSIVLDHELRGSQPLIIYAAHPHFQQTNVISGLPGVGTGGVTESLKRRIVMPFAGPLRETDHVLGHELVHAFQYDITAQSRSASSSALRFPLWFMEGMAEYLSLGPVDVQTAVWLRDAAMREDLPTVGDLNDPSYFPYRYGHAFFAYLGGRYGDRAVGAMLEEARERGVRRALETITGQDEKSLSDGWHASIRDTYEPLLTDPRTAAEYGRALLTDERHGGSLNVAPSLSPDGSQLVFLSERDLFAIEMFLADAESGKVQRKIVETATDPHFESLQFISSSGSWSPDGKSFVFAGVSKGQPVLSFLDVDRADVTNEISFPRLGEIFNPSWSPDGSRILFTAIRGGLLDLYLLDVETDRLSRLTEDPYAELQPSWSPDGSSVVFVTDRFSSNLNALHFGNYELATMEMDSQTIERLEIFPHADQWDPHWVEEGLYFVSDVDGRPNLYRMNLLGGSVHGVTALTTGISGITKLSPAITVASRASRLLFTVREEQEYRIYAIENPRDVEAEAPMSTAVQFPTWAALPPSPRDSSQVATLLGQPERYLPETANFPTDDYRANLNLDYVGQPYLVAGSDIFGSFIGGGISFLWSDMLANHNLGTQFQLTGDFDNVAGIAGYENRSSRWNWGGSMSWIPFLSNRFVSGVAEVQGQVSQVEQVIQLRQTERRARGTVSYPFSRANRIELSGGFVNYGFSAEARTTAFSLETGELLVDETSEIDAPSSVYLGEAAAALVHDTSLLGPTSPLLGSRYRFEAGADVGTLRFWNALADYRHYFMPKEPFTFAVRGMHFGRYGRDADNFRLTNLYLGFPNLVRGYQSGSFTAEECAAGGCDVFNQLLGSKLMVTNFELRFPLIGAFTGEPWGGPIPIELAFFGDAGVAWTSETEPEFFGGDREPVTSAGIALRVALQRFLVLELDFVRPFDRPEKGWLFEFNFKPGF